MHSSHTFSSPAVPSGHSFMHSFVPLFLSLCMKKPSMHDVQSVAFFEHSEHGDEHSMHDCSTVAYPFGHSERHLPFSRKCSDSHFVHVVRSLSLHSRQCSGHSLQTPSTETVPGSHLSTHSVPLKNLSSGHEMHLSVCDEHSAQLLLQF